MTSGEYSPASSADVSAILLLTLWFDTGARKNKSHYVPQFSFEHDSFRGAELRGFWQAYERRQPAGPRIKTRKTDNPRKKERGR